MGGCGASWLHSRGVCAGDRVAIYMSNLPDYLALFYAIWHLGGCCACNVNCTQKRWHGYLKMQVLDWLYQ